MRFVTCVLAVIVSVPLPSCGGGAPPKPVEAGRAAAPPIVLDTDAVDAFLRWADGPHRELFDWRDRQVFAITREWAKGSALPDPDAEIERQLREVAQSGPGDVRVVRARRLLSALEQGRQAFLGSASKHLAQYLPRETPIRGRVVFGVMLPGYAFSDGHNIVINLTSEYWKDNRDKVLNLLVHELFHNGFATHQQARSVAAAEQGGSAISNIAWQIQNEGTATYVAYRAKPPGLEVEDYALLDSPPEVRRRFELVRGLLDRARAGNPDGLAAEIWEHGVKQRAFYVVGAFMARRIEEQRGRAALVATIGAGTRAFFAAYDATSPSEELRIPAMW